MRSYSLRFFQMLSPNACCLVVLIAWGEERRCKVCCKDSALCSGLLSEEQI